MIRRYIMVGIILIGLFGSIGDYFFSKSDSYDKYLEGEYYFIYEAETITARGPDYIMTPDDPMFYADYSDPRNMLLTNALDCKVYNAHDGVCTVIYGDNVIENFPVYRIRVSDEDYPYFHGTKKYTEDEYFAKLDGLDSNSRLLSSRSMAHYRSALKTAKVIVFFDVLILVVLFAIRSHDNGLITDIVLIAGSGYNIVFNIINLMTR